MNHQSTPSNSQTITHGGDPARAEARFGIPELGWLDLSTGINPVGYRCGEMPSYALEQLPRGAEMEALINAARRAYKVPEGAHIIASPGTQALIQVIPTLWPANDVTILTPTYGEHAPAWAAAGHRVETAPSICSQAASPAPFAVVVHPNNPDGRLQSTEGILAYADDLFDRGGVLVIDEAFCDVTPEKSVTPFTGQPGLLVLRSFGKFFGLAGVRLGFAVGHTDTINKLGEKLGPWAVSGPALWAGTQALNDADWAASTRDRLIHDAARMDDMLIAAGFQMVGGTTLFRLADHAHAKKIEHDLGRAGILVRTFPDHPTWIRFGMPGTPKDWARLEAVLNRI